MTSRILPELVDAYSETIISIQIDDLHSLVIRGSNLETDSASFQDSFGAHIQEVWIITADNPYSELLSTEENLQRQRSLHTALSEKGIDVLEALCCSPDGSWSEFSFAIPAEIENVIKVQDAVHELSRSFGQNAVFKITPSTLSVISTLGETRNKETEVLFTSNYSCILN